MSDLTVLDLFCGAGGFSEGFRQQGFTITAGIDRWRPAVETFDHNFGVNSYVEDILSFQRSIKKIEALPDTDVILGSPPCVSFSHSNASGKADKTSGILLTRLFLKIVAVKKFRPNSQLKAWYMENVVNSRKYLLPVYRFKDLGLAKWAENYGYKRDDVAITLDDHQIIVNAANYGAAQKRTRLISGEIIEKEGSIIQVGSFPIPPATHHETADRNVSVTLPPHRTLGEIRDALPKPNDPLSKISVNDPRYEGLVVPLDCLSDHFYDTGLYECEWRESKYLKINHPYMGKMSFPENEQRPSRTVMATRIGTSREAMIFHSEYGRRGNGEYRTATVREAACLMGFPITYQFKGSEGIKWKLVGNAVCPFVSFAFAKQLRKQLGLDVYDLPFVQPTARLIGINNLNMFTEKRFERPPIKNRNSRLRRHAFKDGSMTVTLSNYDIAKKSPNIGRWTTSVQYGTGDGFPIFQYSDRVYELIEPLISQLGQGRFFLNQINNGFLNKVGTAQELQSLYERRSESSNLLGPIELLDEIRRIIDSLDIQNEVFLQEKEIIFEDKKEIPVKQLLALYAISLIAAKANDQS
jgi:DNA (cytosine-5)-methyltransferase 1